MTNKEDTPSRKSNNDSESDLRLPKSDGDKKFWKMHLKNKIADRNGNSDDVFNATNIKAEPPHLGHGGAEVKSQTKVKGVSEATRRVMNKIKEDSQSAGSDNPSSSDSSPPTGNDQKIVDNSSAKASKDPNGFKSVLEKIALQAAQLHDELDDDDMDDIDPDTQTKLNDVKSSLDEIYKSVCNSDNDKSMKSESVIQAGNKYQSNLMHQVKLEAHPLTGLAKGESPMSDSQVRAHYAKHRPESFVAKNPTAPLTNDHKRYAHIDRTFLSKLSDNNAKNKARDDKFYGKANESYDESVTEAMREAQIHKKIMSKAGNHIGTIFSKSEPDIFGRSYVASYHPHGTKKGGGLEDAAPRGWTHHATPEAAEKTIFSQHGLYKSAATKAVQQAEKHKASILETSTSKLKKYISKAEDDRESADNNDYRGSEYNDHDMDYVHDKSGDAKVQARGAKRDKYIKIAQARLDAKKIK